MDLLKRVISAVTTAAHTLSPSCREASRLQSEALDRPLSRAERLGLRLHVLLCSWCRRYGRQIRFLNSAIREHPDAANEGGSQTLSPEARERLRNSLRDGAK
jgi:hypothetical protein